MRVQDPVCGKEIDLGNIAAAEEHLGWMHFFCSTDCRDTFQACPSDFAQGPTGATTKSGLAR